jgi:hypothetical protein
LVARSIIVVSVDVSIRRNHMPRPVLAATIIFAVLTGGLAVMSFAYALAFNGLFSTGEPGRLVTGIAGAVLLNMAIVGTMGMVQRWRGVRSVAVGFGALVGAAGLLVGPFAWLMAPGLASAMLLCLVPSGAAIALLVSLPDSAREWFA